MRHDRARPGLSWPRRLLLRLLPAHVREEHGRELERALGEEEDRLSWRSLAADVLRAAPGAHAEVLRQDLRHGVRQLQRSRSFAVVAVVTLSLGLGGNLAFFTLVDGVLFQPLALQGEDRLVAVSEENLSGGLRDFGVSPANFLDYRRDTSLFLASAAYQVRSGTLRADDYRERVLATSVSGEFFRVFVEPPALGRVLRPEDDVVGGNAVVVSHTFHRVTLGGDPQAVGRTIELDGQPLTIVGVLREGFAFPGDHVALWRPLAMPTAEWERRGARFVSVVARLRDGVSVAQAADRLARIAGELAINHPVTNKEWTVLVRGLRAARVEAARPQLYLVLAAGTLVLLVAVANVAGLLVARAVARQGEFAVRGALGARPGRVARQVTTEALLLTSAGALGGLAVASGVIAWLKGSVGAAVPRLAEVSLGGRTIAVALALATLAALVLGAIVYPRQRQGDLWRVLGTGRASPSRGRSRLQRVLVLGEVAFATFVLVGGSLVGRTMWRLLEEPRGFDARGVVTFRVEPPFRFPLDDADAMARGFGADRRRVSDAYASLIDALRALPGVLDAGAINRLPLTGNYWVTSVAVPGRPSVSANGKYQTWIRPVTAGYLETMRTRVLRGRALARADDATGEPVVLVDEALARKLWGEEDPVGQELHLDGAPGTLNRARVVGVTESVHMNRLDAAHAGTLYVPLGQSMEGFFPNWGMDVVVRSAASAPLMADYRRIAASVFPDAVTFGETTMEALVSASVADRRFHLLVLAVFSGLALVLATVGVAGALLLAVRERRRELAVRMALGASLRRMWWEVQFQGLGLVLGGAAIGMAAALAGAQLFRSLVYGIPLRDPWSFALAPALLLAAGFVAVAVPATRAIRVSPTAALREG